MDRVENRNEPAPGFGRIGLHLPLDIIRWVNANSGKRTKGRFLAPMLTKVMERHIREGGKRE